MWPAGDEIEASSRRLSLSCSCKNCEPAASSPVEGVLRRRKQVLVTMLVVVASAAVFVVLVAHEWRLLHQRGG